MIDYKDLLLKYIFHVGNEEGTSFIREEPGYKPDYFTDKEWAELNKLDQIDTNARLVQR